MRYLLALLLMPAAAGAIELTPPNPNAGLSLTGGNVSFNAAYGHGMGTGSSTAPACGTIFFISSNTVASTATFTTSLNVLSTYTVVANTLVTLGDRIFIECAFQNGGVAPGTPVYGTYLNSTALATAADNTASATNVVRTALTLTKVGAGFYFSESRRQVAAGSADVALGASIGISEQTFDATAANTFKCAASRASGGAINFVYMRVSKACN